MKLIEIEGDLVEMWLKREIDVGFQNCNCFNTQNSGLARQVKAKIPDVFEIDSLTVRGDPKKLGQFSAYEKQKERQIFINLYGQYKYGRENIQYLDYDALFKALTSSCEFILKLGYGNERLGFPHGMGAGLARGDWSKILPMIKYVFGETDFEVYIIKLNSKLKN